MYKVKTYMCMNTEVVTNIPLLANTPGGQTFLPVPLQKCFGVKLASFTVLPYFHLLTSTSLASLPFFRRLSRRLLKAIASLFFHAKNGMKRQKIKYGYKSAAFPL